MQHTGFTRSSLFSTMSSLCLFLICVFSVFAATVVISPPTRAEDAPILYTLPEGWEQNDENAAVAAATSPDQSIRIIVRYSPHSSPMTAMQIIKKQMTRVKHDRVITPPTDMSRFKAQFNADSVAKMQLSGIAPNGGKFLYRAFVFVKGSNFAVIEALVNTQASEETFKQADETIKSFRFK